MLTVCCVLCDGPVSSFTADCVVRLERMVRRYLDRSFSFVCFTDGTRGAIPKHIQTVRIPSCGQEIPANGRGFWNKLQVFNPSHRVAFGDRALFFDLDVLIVADLSPLVDFPGDFALTEDALVVERAHIDRDRYGRQIVRRFNSSVMLWTPGEQDRLFTGWRAVDAHRLMSDQDWIGEQAPDAVGMPLAWFPRISQLVKDEVIAKTGQPMPTEAKVVLVKKPKPVQAAATWPWFEPMWGGWAA